MSRDSERLRLIADNLDANDWLGSAYSLRRIAERLTADELDINARLTNAGIQAAEAQHLADELRKQLVQDRKTAAAAKQQFARVAGEAVRLNGELTRDLTIAKNNNQIAQRTIAFLLDELAASDVTREPLNVRVQFTDEPGGLTPGEASDLALALSLANDGQDAETT